VKEQEELLVEVAELQLHSAAAAAAAA